MPGPGHSSPVLWGDKIFLTCENVEQQERFVLGLSAADGRTLFSWKDKFQPYEHHRFNSYAASTPAVDASRVYVSWVSGKTFIVLALDHQGNLLWQTRMDDFEARFGAGASPIVLDDLVIMANDHAGRHSFLVGLDAATGATRRQIPRRSGEQESYAAPAVRRLDNGQPEAVFVSPSHGVTGVDPRTGEVRWELDGLFTFRVVASPVVADGLIFACSGKGNGGREAVVVRPGDPATGRQAELVYQVQSALPYVPTPVAHQGDLFLWSDMGVVTCLKLSTGERLWQERVGGEYYCSPICVNGRIYCASKTGEVVVLEAGPRYKLLARNQLPEGCYATPAVANGCMYIRTYNHLICLTR